MSIKGFAFSCFSSPDAGSAWLRKARLGGVSLAFLSVLALAAMPADASAKTTNINKSKSVSAVSSSNEENPGSEASESVEATVASSGGVAVTGGVTPEPMAVGQSQSSALAQAPAPAPAVFPGVSATDSLAAFGPSSGTAVGKRALELRDDVLRLRSSVNLNAGEFSLSRANGAAGAVQYHSTVAAITARLQNGTTRGNPILLRQWGEAENSLNQVTTSLERLNGLQTSVSADASLASYLLESVQAGFQLSGAVDEDHDQLKLLRDEISRMVVQLDYLRNQVADDIQRQTTYLTAERSNLQSLAFAINRGELLGNSLANRPVVVTPAPSPVVMLPQQQYGYQQQAAPAPLASAPMPQQEYAQETGQMGAAAPVMPSGDVGVAPTAGRLLVLIRYNQPVVEYEQQLSRAVGSALQRKPNAEFSIVAVTPASGDPGELATAQELAGRNAESVKRSLVQLGLAPARISVAGTQAQSAQTPEVHVYVR